MRKLILSLKVEVKAKEVAMWFGLSFIGVLFIFLYIMKRKIDTFLLLETLGFAVVFVLMIFGTKIYNHFIESYYQSYINH